MITTYTGRRIDPLQLRPEDVCIEDIAHHLACVNRFNGALREPVSVAQHSVYVSRLVADYPCELQALLHDASEAYLLDIPKWLKRTPEMAAYRAAEARAEQVIFERFNCELVLHAAVEEADRIMVRYEAERMLAAPLWTPDDSKDKYPALTDEERLLIEPWQPWLWQDAEHIFLEHFHWILSRT
jgi:hypothetical protein